MRFLLSEVQTGISQPQVGEIVFQIGTDVFPALYIIATCLCDQEGFCQTVDMFGNGLVRIGHLTSAGEGVGNSCWIGRGPDGRCQYIDQNAYLIRILYPVPFYYIFQIYICKDVLQIISFLAFALEPTTCGNPPYTM